MRAALAELLVGRDWSVRDVMACIDRSGKGIVLVVDPDHRIVATITDGDIRRAILAGVNLDLPVQALLDFRAQESTSPPVTAPLGTSDAELLRMMNELGLRHIPLLDESGRVVDVALLSDLVKDYELPLTAIVMAGGYGTRLRPLTEDTPKPMLLVGNRPLLETTIEQLRRSGIRRVKLTTHYKSEIITQHFGDGRDFGVEIRYINEDRPMGTAGALSLISATDEHLLVVNGDILTGVDFRSMMDFHREQHADMTVGVRQYELRIPYGVIETDGPNVVAISEKPTVRYYINAGIYLLSSRVHQLIPNGLRYDMTDLINQVLAAGHRVASFPIQEYWLDIGQIEDYEQAQIDVEANRLK